MTAFSSPTALPPGMHGGKGGRQLGWPRCRWCHQEIRPSTGEEFAEFENHGVLPRAWYHITTESEQCEGRTNKAEPVPQIHEEPFMEAAWEFVSRYRTLRRAFRDLSTSRASAVRRMQDYQKLADAVIDAYDNSGIKWREQTEAELQKAIVELRTYRKNTQAAGWR